jgi:hypothetical protein
VTQTMPRHLLTGDLKSLLETGSILAS